MTATTLITLRETLEASLIVGIILAYLQFTHNQRYNIAVWLGVMAGVAMSLVLAILMRVYFGGFTGTAEALYEGITMIAGAGLITWMIIWMMRQSRTIRSDIEGEVALHLENEHPFGIFFLVMISTAREGVETVIFLQAALAHTGGIWQLIGGFVGIAIAIGLSYMLFRGIKLVSLRHVFKVTSILLIFFAAGLTAHGVHELQEAGWIPVLIGHIWDINPIVTIDGIYPALHEKGAIGSVFKGLFGYNGNPNFLEVMVYLLYLSGITLLWKKETRTSH